jgi:hypothetical protein
MWEHVHTKEWIDWWERETDPRQPPRVDIRQPIEPMAIRDVVASMRHYRRIAESLGPVPEVGEPDQFIDDAPIGWDNETLVAEALAVAGAEGLLDL